MKQYEKKNFTETQIVKAIQEHESGRKASNTKKQQSFKYKSDR
jgi:hypothetical protein